jgi:hypothetical protein
MVFYFDSFFEKGLPGSAPQGTAFFFFFGFYHNIFLSLNIASAASPWNRPTR